MTFGALRHLARATYKMSQVMKTLGNEQESTRLLNEAMDLRIPVKLSSGEKSPSGWRWNDFEGLVPWMLW